MVCGRERKKVQMVSSRPGVVPGLGSLRFSRKENEIIGPSNTSRY